MKAARALLQLYVPHISQVCVPAAVCLCLSSVTKQQQSRTAPFGFFFVFFFPEFIV